MAEIIEWLKGKKTYFVAALAILTAVVAYINGGIDVKQLVEAIFAALGGITLRAAVAKGATKLLFIPLLVGGLFLIPAPEADAGPLRAVVRGAARVASAPVRVLKRGHERRACRRAARRAAR